MNWDSLRNIMRVWHLQKWEPFLDKRKWVFNLAGLGGFLISELALYFFADRPIDLFTHKLASSSPQITGFFSGVTDLGKSFWYLTACGIATIFCAFLSHGKDVPRHYRRLFSYVGIRAFLLFATIGISGIVADILKPIIGRARPSLWLHEGIYGFSPWTFNAKWNGMPSGHTTTAFALAFSLSALYPRLRVLWLAYATLLSVSRVIVDAHYPSDVVAGAVLGWITVKIFLKHGAFLTNKIFVPIENSGRTK